MSHPLSAADYSDWCTYAGLYLANISHADRYRTFQKKISAAGLAIKIVYDLLESNPGGLDLQAWRNANVYELGGEAGVRIEQTALALEAIGAPRAAAKVRTRHDNSLLGGIQELIASGAGRPGAIAEMMKGKKAADLIAEFRGKVARAMPELAKEAGMPTPEAKPVPPDAEIESKEQIEHLLGEYVRAHEPELRGDMAKYGDPRTEPGFDPGKRMDELDDQRRRAADREIQKDDVQKMNALMETIESKLAKNPKLKPGKIAPSRREFLQYYRKYARRPADELLPATQQWLKHAERFQEKHQHIFRPPAIDDEALLKRLADIGAYEVDIDGRSTTVSWDEPAGLTCEWTAFSLSVHCRPDNAKELAALLDGVARLQKRFAEHQAQLRREVLESFEIYRDMYARSGYRGLECGPDGLPTEASILAEAGAGGIHLRLEGDADVHIEVFFHVNWDDEHGLELFLEDEPDKTPADLASSLANVAFTDGGQPITTETLAAFELEHHIQLPADYRAFLLRQNGGRPPANTLTVKMQWGSTPIFVELFYPVETKDGPKVADSLGDAYLIHLANDLPAHLLPIGRVRMSDPGAGPVRVNLLIGLSGKHAGKIFIAGDAMMMQAEMAPVMTAEVYELCCSKVAPSFNAFLERLISS